MIKRVKKWLGIEGVKVELVLPEELDLRTERIQGKVRLSSLEEQEVTELHFRFIEKYSRGRGENKLIDEYELGRSLLERNILVPKETVVEVDFALPFKLVKSEVDDFGDKNLLFGGLAKLARMSRGVRSDYRVEVEARVKGVALNPFDRKYVEL